MRTSTEQKLARGTKNTSGNRDFSPATAPPGRPECPIHLEGMAKRFFEDTYDHLASMGLESEVDVAGIELMAATYETWRKARASVAKHGLLSKGKRGLVKNPATAIEKDARDSLIRMMTMFGLNPRGRSQVRGNVSAEPADPFADWLKNRGSSN